MTHSWLSIAKTIALSMAIIVVFNLFIGMGLRTFYPGPDYEDFCPMDKQIPTTQTQCEAEGGKWFEPPVVTGEASFAQPQPYCDNTFACRQEFEDKNEVYRRDAFIVWVIAGFIALVAGQMITASPSVSSGFTFGGVVSFIIGAAGYWSQMDETLRFILLGVVLAVLVWLGYRKSKEM